MGRAPRSLFILAAVLVLWSIVLPHWFEEHGHWDTSWGVWGAHSCNTGYDECDFPSFDSAHSGEKYVGYLVIAAGLAMALGLFAAIIAMQRMPWMRTTIKISSVIGIFAAGLFATLQPEAVRDAIPVLGPNLVFYLIGAVLAFAVAATSAFEGLIDPQPEPILEPGDEPSAPSASSRTA